jgi:hypothetical protein
LRKTSIWYWYVKSNGRSDGRLKSSSLVVYSLYIIKVLVQPGLSNNGRNFGRNLNHQTSYLLIYKCEVAKLRSKAGNFWKERESGKGGDRKKER